MDELFELQELKTIEVDTEKKIFRVNGKDFGKNSSGFDIHCDSIKDFDIRMSIDTHIGFVAIRDGKRTEAREYEEHCRRKANTDWYLNKQRDDVE